MKIPEKGGWVISTFTISPLEIFGALVGMRVFRQGILCISELGLSIFLMAKKESVAIPSLKVHSQNNQNKAQENCHLGVASQNDDYIHGGQDGFLCLVLDFAIRSNPNADAPF